jgi:hypothetical protein
MLINILYVFSDKKNHIDNMKEKRGLKYSQEKRLRKKLEADIHITFSTFGMKHIHRYTCVNQ